MAKIGIMGGTFDPIHNGHLLLGRQAYQEYRLDQVWFMPCGQPPHKKDHKITEADKRCEMTELAIANNPNFILSKIEANRKGNTYTAQTLDILHKEYPEHTFYFIIGADSLFEIGGWYKPELILHSATLLVANRSYDKAGLSVVDQIRLLKKVYGAKICLLHCERIDISSADLRHMYANGESLAPYVPESVENYIRLHHLYQETEDEKTNT